MVYSQRKRRQETAEREESGEDLWTDRLDDRVLRRLDALWELIEEPILKRVQSYELHGTIAKQLRLQGGWPVGEYVGPGFLVRQSESPPELVLDVLDVLNQVFLRAFNVQDFEDQVNSILNEHRIAFRMVEGEMVAFSSDELQASVVEPVLRLLIGRRFISAHDAYMKALKEITNGDAGDAITDAGTALQEALTSLGFQGNALGPLLKDAKKKNLLAAHDVTLSDGIAKFIDWASADRSTTGDAHGHNDPALADAWLMVHVVGALIVRLADPTLPRGEPRG